MNYVNVANFLRLHIILYSYYSARNCNMWFWPTRLLAFWWAACFTLVRTHMILRGPPCPTPSRRITRTITIDDQPGNARPQQRSVKPVRHPPSDLKRTRIPGDMAPLLILSQAEAVIVRRKETAGVITKYDKGATAVRVFLDHMAPMLPALMCQRHASPPDD